MNVPPQQEFVIFTDALRIPVGQREDFLDQACAGDYRLRQKVEGLLETHEQLADFLEQPPHELVTEARREAAASEKPAEQIGRYKLLQQIGEGGCGVVFLAEQAEPIRRRVALKVIKPGMDTKSVIARFEAERQALALMAHPSIAKVFDAGATESGRPYFVMELVRGVKITEYCDEHSLTTEERLNLFIQVCAAIQHAHQKGIIHRDIKPSNILVTTTSDGTALPVVIDFGIAKPTMNQRLTDKTLFTGLEMFIGTPAYISPEQAALTSADVDTRSDIYSLGVLLYELLTGSKPFDTTELLKKGIDEIRRVIREQEPVRPSTRLTKLKPADLTAVAQHRRSDVPRLLRTVCGDLDWIVMKAMEKDRARRYETANGLALDAKRFLDHEPVLARPPSKRYRFGKAVQRNKFLFFGIGIIAALLIASLIIVTVSLADERKARRDAEIEKRKAQTETAKSQQVTRFLEDMLEGVGPSFARGRDTMMVEEILVRTDERVGTELTNQPAVEVQLRRIVGRVFLEIGKYERAEKSHSVEVALNRKLFGEESEATATALCDLGNAYWKQRKLAEAETVLLESLKIRRRVKGDESAEVAEILSHLGNVFRRQRKLEQSEALTRQALAIRQRLFGNEHLDVADSLRNLSMVLTDRRELVKAEELARTMLAIRRRLLGNEHSLVAAAITDVAWVVSVGGRLKEAELLETEAFEIRRKYLGDKHPDVARSVYLFGERMRQQGNLTESHPVLNVALSLQRTLLGEDHPDVLATLRSLISILDKEAKWDEAEILSRETLGLWRKRAGNEDPQTLYALRDLGKSLEGQAKWSAAETVHREALALWRKVGGNEDPQTLYTLNRLGTTLEAQEKLSEAEAVRREALASWRKRAGDEDTETLYAMRNLAKTLEAAGKPSEASASHREALALWRKVRGSEDSQTLYTLSRLGATLEAEGKLAEAEVVRLEALASWRKRAGNEDTETLSAMRSLAKTLEAEGKPSEASTLHRETLALLRKMRGNEHSQTLSTLSRLGATLEAEGKLSEAEVVRSEALALWRKRGEGETAQALDELKGLVRVLNLQKKFGEAEKILTATLTPAFVQQRASVDLLDRRMELLVRQERWKEAVLDATLALQHQPNDHTRYHSLAPLLVATIDQSAYKELCQEMLRRFGHATNIYVADRVAKSCLLSPSSDVDLLLVDKLIDTALAAGEGDVCMPLFKMVKGLSMLRFGNYAKAIEWTEKSLNGPFVHPKAQGYAILAMAHWRLGHKEEAQVMLDKGNALAPPVASNDPAARGGEKWTRFYETSYHARLLARIQLEEARALIESRPLPDNHLSSPEKRID